MIHTYNNGLRFHIPPAFNNAVNRAKKYINLHEPFEEIVFDHVFKNYKINSFVDIGCAWGYYSLLVKKYNKDCHVYAFDINSKMCEFCKKNQEFNMLPHIDIRDKGIPRDVSLKNVINELGGIDLIKIDIQGTETRCLQSAGDSLRLIKNIIIGTHGQHHNKCVDLLSSLNFKIKLSYAANEIPIQPDGLIWASSNE